MMEMLDDGLVVMLKTEEEELDLKGTNDIKMEFEGINEIKFEEATMFENKGATIHEIDEEALTDDHNSHSSDKTPLPDVYGAKKKAKLTRVVLPAADEVDVVEWLQQTTWIYDRGSPLYLDATRKLRYYDNKAKTLRASVTGAQLRAWVENMRSRYGKLVKKASGDTVPQHSKRDKWILYTFSFFAGHIKHKKTRTIRKFKGSATVPEAVPGPSQPHIILPTTKLARSVDLSSDEEALDVPPEELPTAASTSSIKGKRKRQTSGDPSGMTKLCEHIGSMATEMQAQRKRLEPDQSGDPEINLYCSYFTKCCQNLPKDIWMQLQVAVNTALLQAKELAMQRQQQQQQQQVAMPQVHGQLLQGPHQTQLQQTHLQEVTQPRLALQQIQTLLQQSLLQPMGHPIPQTSSYFPRPTDTLTPSFGTTVVTPVTPGPPPTPDAQLNPSLSSLVGIPTRMHPEDTMFHTPAMTSRKETPEEDPSV